MDTSSWTYGVTRNIWPSIFSPVTASRKAFSLDFRIGIDGVCWGLLFFNQPGALWPPAEGSQVKVRASLKVIHLHDRVQGARVRVAIQRCCYFSLLDGGWYRVTFDFWPPRGRILSLTIWRDRRASQIPMWLSGGRRISILEDLQGACTRVRQRGRGAMMSRPHHKSQRSEAQWRQSDGNRSHGRTFWQWWTSGLISYAHSLQSF